MSATSFKQSGTAYCHPIGITHCCGVNLSNATESDAGIIDEVFSTKRSAQLHFVLIGADTHSSYLSQELYYHLIIHDEDALSYSKASPILGPVLLIRPRMLVFERSFYHPAGIPRPRSCTEIYEAILKGSGCTRRRPHLQRSLSRPHCRLVRIYR